MIKIQMINLIKLEFRLEFSRNHFNLKEMIRSKLKRLLKGYELKRVSEVAELEAFVSWVCSIARYPQTVNSFSRIKKRCSQKF